MSVLDDKEKLDATRCCAQVRSDTRMLRWHQCLRFGAFTYDGKRYCRTHFPPDVENRQQMRDAKYAMESDLRMAKWKKESVREKLFPKLVEALDGLNGAACPPSTTEYNRVDRLIKQARRAL